MKAKLTHTLPQIRCTEETRKAFDDMCIKKSRSISNVLQIYTEKIAKKYIEKGSVFKIDSLE